MIYNKLLDFLRKCQLFNIRRSEPINMSYATKDIRNIALLGHGGNGKSSLAESILFLTGVTDRLGSTAAGNSVSDYDAEEIRRQISISATTMYTDYQKTKINIIDTPGYFDFAGEVAEALRVADTGIICVAAKDGVNVGAEKAWKALTEANLPKAIYISKIDEEHADYFETLSQLRDKFGRASAPWRAHRRGRQGHRHRGHRGPQGLSV